MRKRNVSLSKLFIYPSYRISQRVYEDITGRHDTPKPTVNELYQPRWGLDDNRQARRGRSCSFCAAGLINIMNVSVPMSTHSMLVI